MYTRKTVFSQVMDYVPMYEFRKCIDRYNGNYHTSSFSWMDRYLCMSFAQLTYRESLRDIEACPPFPRGETLSSRHQRQNIA